MSQFTAQQIADLLKGTVEGNPKAIVTKLAKIEEGVDQSVSFLSNPAYTSYIYTTDASVVIVSNDLILEKPVKSTCTLIRVQDPRASFSILLDAYNQINTNAQTGIEQPCFIAKSASIGKNAYIGAFSYIGEHVKIGDNVKIHPRAYIASKSVIGDDTVLLSGVTLHADTVIGKKCLLHSGVVIGGDGFGFTPNTENNYKKVPQIGNVVIEDHVEIGSNTTIDRATLGSTIIRKGVKLDNLIQIAHNVEIGENTVIAAQTGIAGSAKIGKNCIIGGQVGIVGHISIADGTKIAAQSGISNTIKEENEILQGSPAFKQSDYKRAYVLFRNLPKINSQLIELEKLKRDTLHNE